MRSLYVLSSPRSRSVGNRELDFRVPDQAKSDIGRGQDRDLRRLVASKRQPGRNLREACWIVRKRGRYLRESSKEGDSHLPLCSLNVLLGFLQASFAVSR